MQKIAILNRVELSACDDEEESFQRNQSYNFLKTVNNNIII